MRKAFHTLLLLLLVKTLFAQKTPLNGLVSDPTGEPLAFVSVLLNDDPSLGVLTDIEGRFQIGGDFDLRTLTLRYVGFETLRLDSAFLNQKREKLLEITLLPSDYNLNEVVIRPGENPAERLIRLAIRHRHDNNPERRKAFACTTYNKVLFEALPHRDIFEKTFSKRDSTQKTVRRDIEKFKNLEASAQKQHLFLMESVTERRFRFPDQVQENVVLNRVSGFKNAGLVALANAVQPFTFYGDYLRILDKNFLNPISPNSPTQYFFLIEDTLFSAKDTIWVISFRPRKGKIFDALAGTLHLHSDGWAIQNVLARPADPNSNIDLKIEQAYIRLATNAQADTAAKTIWFPSQLNFELEFRRYPAPHAGIRAAGRSYITDANLNPTARRRHFDPEMPLTLAPKANTRADSAWARWRTVAPLTRKEYRTYTYMDSLGARKKMDGWANAMDYLATGRVPLKAGICLDLNRLLVVNDFEGTRLGVGFSNAQSKPLLLPKRLESGIYVGYGLRDHAAKYGGYALWRIVRGWQTQLRVGWQRDLREPGALYELRAASILNRSLYADRMDYTDEWAAALSSQLWRGALASATFRDQHLRPGYDYRFGAPDGAPQTQFHFREMTLALRYAWAEEPRRFLGNDAGSVQKVPVLELAYTRGWGGHSYERWAAALYQSVFVRRLGRLTWRLEAGHVTPNVPLAKLFTLNQSGNQGANWIAAPSTFQALPDTLFLADRFANLFVAQEIGPVLWRKKRSAPYCTLLQNVAWGALHRPEWQQDIGFRTAAAPLLETGIRLDNLLQFNYLNFARFGIGTAIFYRWGGLQAEEGKSNVVLRLALRMSL